MQCIRLGNNIYFCRIKRVLHNRLHGIVFAIIACNICILNLNIFIVRNIFLRFNCAIFIYYIFIIITHIFSPLGVILHLTFYNVFISSMKASKLYALTRLET